MNELLERIEPHLEAFERQLRYLASSRKHNGPPGPAESMCHGPGVCVRCSMEKKADDVADDLAAVRMRAHDRMKEQRRRDNEALVGSLL